MQTASEKGESPFSISRSAPGQCAWDYFATHVPDRTLTPESRLITLVFALGEDPSLLPARIAG